jgi:hypothetical protein
MVVYLSSTPGTGMITMMMRRSRTVTDDISLAKHFAGSQAIVPGGLRLVYMAYDVTDDLRCALTSTAAHILYSPCIPLQTLTVCAMSAGMFMNHQH